MASLSPTSNNLHGLHPANFEKKLTSVGNILQFQQADKYTFTVQFLWALEINCYLQIDVCVAQYGFSDGGTVRAETAALRTEYESLGATLEAVDLAGSIRERQPENPDSEERPLIDLAPSTL
ncbi:hypothetical protein PENDEC_c020G04011 [Penicillium decumbens]|uniref:Uncharacterized protein n=1 Tax=Penicillium decumbens TaxID=69771 RepID=A0A1V6P781_PENDC|nr:hypothetical protein PENDEC_c020G04011 [Penicillium decumbens]